MLDNNTTVYDFLFYYNETFIKESRTHRTYLKYRSTIENQIKPFFKTKTVKELDKSLILNYYSYLENNYSPHTINTNSIILKAGLEILRQQYLIRENFAKFIPRKRTRSKGIPRLSKEEIEKLVTLFKEDTNYGDFFYFLYLTGMRRGEALAITSSDIDRTNNTITINKQITQKSKNGGSSISYHTKSKKPRTIRASSEIFDIVDRRIKLNASYKSNYRSYHDSGLLFQSQRGQCIFNPSLVKSFKNIASKIGHHELTFHDLRKLRAINLTENQSLNVAKKQLGHSRGSTTIKYYSSVTLLEMEELCKLIDTTYIKLSGEQE